MRAATFLALALPASLGCIGAVGGPVGGGDGTADGTASAAPTAGSLRTPANGAGVPVPAVPPDRLCGSAPARIVKLTAAQYGRTVAGLLPGTAAGGSLGADLDDLVPARSDEFSNNAGTPTLSQPYVAQLYRGVRTMVAQAVATPGRLAGCLAKATDPACVRSFVEGFGARAWRRALAAAEIDGLVTWSQEQTTAYGAPAALELLVARVLLSPDALFRTELGPEGTAAGREVLLTPAERASALSYLVADGPPDADLGAAAANGGLETPEQMAAQARRLLARSDSALGLRQLLAESFAYGQVAGVRKDAALFPDMTPAIAADMARESSAFIDDVLWQADGRLATLLSAPYTVASAKLGAFYGLASKDTLTVAGQPMLRYQLPQGRAGILTHGSLMARLAHENDTNPVVRGRYIRETVLCQKVPNPPPNLDVTPPPPDGMRTHRERLARHSSDPGCATCHSLLDPIGLGFENLDAVGRFRTTEAGKAIDASGSLDDAGAFRNAGELAGLLAASPLAARCLAERATSYGIARTMAAEDACLVDRLRSRFAGSNGQIADLLVALVSDRSFIARRVP